MSTAPPTETPGYKPQIDLLQAQINHNEAKKKWFITATIVGSVVFSLGVICLMSLLTHQQAATPTIHRITSFISSVASKIQCSPLHLTIMVTGLAFGLLLTGFLGWMIFQAKIHHLNKVSPDLLEKPKKAETKETKNQKTALSPKELERKTRQKRNIFLVATIAGAILFALSLTCLTSILLPPHQMTPVTTQISHYLNIISNALKCSTLHFELLKNGFFGGFFVVGALGWIIEEIKLNEIQKASRRIA